MKISTPLLIAAVLGGAAALNAGKKNREEDDAANGPLRLNGRGGAAFSGHNSGIRFSTDGGNRSAVGPNTPTGMDATTGGQGTGSLNGMLIQQLRNVAIEMPGCAPIIKDYIGVLTRIDERDSGERGGGLLGISAAYDKARSISLGRKATLCITGVDVGGLGGDEIVSFLESGLNAAGGRGFQTSGNVPAQDVSRPEDITFGEGTGFMLEE